MKSEIYLLCEIKIINKQCLQEHEAWQHGGFCLPNPLRCILCWFQEFGAHIGKEMKLQEMSK